MINYYSFPGLIYETVGFVKKTVFKPTDRQILNKIFFQVELETSVHSSEMLSKSRRKEIRQARQLVHFFCREFSKMSYATIGAATNKDHSSVIHSVKTVKNDLEKDGNLKIMFNSIKENLKKELLIF